MDMQLYDQQEAPSRGGSSSPKRLYSRGAGVRLRVHQRRRTKREDETGTAHVGIAIGACDTT